MISDYFSDAELNCNCGCQLKQFHPGFLDRLEALRVDFGQGMTVNSACRCVQHNANVGGHPNSLHVGNQAQHPGQQGTLAIDIFTQDGGYRGKLFAAAWRLGWSVGWNGPKKFLHLDRRVDLGLPQLIQTSFDY